MSDTQSVVTLDMIARKLPSEVLDQTIYKAKIVFLGVDRNDPSYMKFKNINVNCHEYMIADSQISYIPEEVMSALKSAVSYVNVPDNDKQKDDGLDGDNPRDKYKKIADPRFDVTVLDTFKVIIDSTGKRSLKSDSLVTALELEETKNGILKEEKIRIEKELREEYEERYNKKIEEMKSSIPEATSESVINELLAGDE